MDISPDANRMAVEIDSASYWQNGDGVSQVVGGVLGVSQTEDALCQVGLLLVERNWTSSRYWALIRYTIKVMESNYPSGDVQEPTLDVFQMMFRAVELVQERLNRACETLRTANVP